MFTAAQIMEKIHTGENSGVEFKEARINNGKVAAPHRDSLSDELAAFANQSGGIIIFGITDNTQQIVGINPPNISTLVSYISEICHDSVDPPIVDFYVDNVQVPDEAGDGKYLVYVQVGRSLWPHKSSNGYFYRHGNSKREMSTEYLIRVAQSRSQARIVPFDEQAVPNTDRSTLQQDLHMRFVADDSPSSLRQRRLLVSHNDNLHATVAGVLMCSPKPDQHIYNSYIQAVFYRGKTKDANYQIDAKDHHGPLDKQIIGAWNFVSQYNRLSAKKEVGRIERPQYSMKAVFEALVNAVVHRDYSIHGSKIRLFMFADRLELCSPGALANTLTVESLIDNQFTRNELLSRLLSELSMGDEMGQVVNRRYFLERRGEGVGIILRESESLSGSKPVYELSGGELKLTVYAAESLQESGHRPRQPESQVQQPESQPESQPQQPESQPESQPQQPESQPESQVQQPESQPESQVQQPESQPESQVQQPESQPESLQMKVLGLLASGPMSKAELSDHLGQKKVSGQLNKAVRQLITERMIEYTLPAKPRSRLQKYRITDNGMAAISDTGLPPVKV